MRLYSGSSIQFVEDNVRNQIAEKLRTAFFQHFRYNPSPAEVGAWRNSLRAFSQVLDHGDLKDHGVMVEYQLPLTSKRLDCLVCGRNSMGKDQAVIIELKQWENCESSETVNTVVTWVGGAKREVLHPSVQVGQYAMYLQDFQSAFYEENAVGLDACSYLHNYTPAQSDFLYDEAFRAALDKCPVFNADDYGVLTGYLRSRLDGGEGLDVLKRIEESKFRPSKKLMEHVAAVIKGKREYILLDEQLVVYQKVLSRANEGFHERKKRIILVKGGPGTGKSVIAMNLLGDLMARGYNTHYATGSRAFTETLRKIIGARGGAQFKYFNSYIEAEPDSVDVLVADEAHRIRATSNSRFMAKKDRSSRPQIEELMRAARVGVFFIDDDQVVRPGEVGSTVLIRDEAERMNCSVDEYELEAQFRCAGSDAFVNWVNNTLGIKRTANAIWDRKESFDFKIFPSPEEVERAIREKVSEGSTGRMTAGYCWKWSLPDKDGNLLDEVVIGAYKRPWDAKPEAKKLAKGIPKAVHWAYDPNGINQVGCVYTAQGFEFDYVGVIIGRDLRYDLDAQEWRGFPEESHDSVVKRGRDRFVEHVKNTYRVLLSRGMKGCYVHFMDKDTERFFRSRMD